MFKTVFDKYAIRISKGGFPWIALCVIALLMFSAAFIFSSGKYYALPGPILIWGLWRFGRIKRENVTFFVSKDDYNNFHFGYVDQEMKRQSWRVDEYTYWYMKINENKYELYYMIRSNQNPVYLKEVKEMNAPPANWPMQDERIKDHIGSYIVPDLEELAKSMDMGSENEYIASTSQTSVQ